MVYEAWVITRPATLSSYTIFSFRSPIKEEPASEEPSVLLRSNFDPASFEEPSVPSKRNTVSSIKICCVRLPISYGGIGTSNLRLTCSEKILSNIEASSGVKVVVSAVNPDIRPAVGSCNAADINDARVTLPKGIKPDGCIAPFNSCRYKRV